MIFAYVRVSTTSQDLKRQEIIIAKWLAENGIEDIKGYVRWYREKESGESIQGRTVFMKLLSEIREDDTLVVTSIDRLTRKYKDLNTIMNKLKDKGASYEILDAEFLSPSAYPKGFATIIPDMLIQVFGYMAEMELKSLRERQQQGIALARAKGVYNKPRKKTATSEANKALLLQELEAGNHDRKELETILGVSRPTLLKMIYELGYTKEDKKQ